MRAARGATHAWRGSLAGWRGGAGSWRHGPRPMVEAVLAGNATRASRQPAAAAAAATAPSDRAPGLLTRRCGPETHTLAAHARWAPSAAGVCPDPPRDATARRFGSLGRLPEIKGGFTHFSAVLHLFLARSAPLA
jgi:hypothetical protein